VLLKQLNSGNVFKANTDIEYLFGCWGADRDGCWDQAQALCPRKRLPCSSTWKKERTPFTASSNWKQLEQGLVKSSTGRRGLLALLKGRLGCFLKLVMTRSVNATNSKSSSIKKCFFKRFL
jgi:hypothetical protein